MEKAETERAPSQSPTRRGRTSISDSISSGLNRFLSKDDPNSSNISTVTEGEEFYVAVPITDRSVSRGRDAGFTSSGRGGAGNIRRTSASADASDSIISNPKEDAADEVSSPRGREIEVSPKVLSSGRGGAGNIRSKSRNGRSLSKPPSIAEQSALDERERQVLEEHRLKKQEQAGVLVSGRGGLGNIRSASQGPKSRSRSRAAELRSTGRGGAGNMSLDAPDIASLEIAEERERSAHHHPEGVHSTGRGGAGNIYAHTPNVHGHDDEDNRGRHAHSGVHGLFEKIRAASQSATRSVASVGHPHGHSHLNSSSASNAASGAVNGGGEGDGLGGAE
ncbi:hypothetical protein SISNIDRAFT_232605 [Sistotremastrum niveocremeum HHB9708]|uniref:Uncharacterized protein n=1 Tax=Sistotremastrum niveocremeum HHB9708 TaxID=1314777 RepID=A0A164Q1M5_9AGAM|nr:hypothetical protein SISNIDRAFT_232605 [Sistotremastrum niveocremeum HHB9708]